MPQEKESEHLTTTQRCQADCIYPHFLHLPSPDEPGSESPGVHALAQEVYTTDHSQAGRQHSLTAAAGLEQHIPGPSPKPTEPLQTSGQKVPPEVLSVGPGVGLHVDLQE